MISLENNIMTTKEGSNKIPKKFRNLKRSFISTATIKNDHNFMAFPKNADFQGREDGENIILVVRSHWIIYLPQVIGAILVLILPWILLALIPGLKSSVGMFLALLITGLIMGASVVIDAFVKWLYNVSIITDQRVIDLDFPNIMAHSMAEAQLEKIEDVSHKQIGLLGSFFDVGTVYVQTAGTAQNIEFQNVPRPRDVEDILVDLLESKEKGEI